MSIIIYHGRWPDTKFEINRTENPAVFAGIFPASNTKYRQPPQVREENNMKNRIIFLSLSPEIMNLIV